MLTAGPYHAANALRVSKLFASSMCNPCCQPKTSPTSESAESQNSHEPRATLILNRFTRTSTIMYVTANIEQVLGKSLLPLQGNSFYSCVAEESVDKVRATIETAKTTGLTAYFRFAFRPSRFESFSIDSDFGETTLSRSMASSAMAQQRDKKSQPDGIDITIANINYPPSIFSGNSLDNVNTSGSALLERLDVVREQDLMFQSDACSSNVPVADLPLPGAPNHDVDDVAALAFSTADGLVVVLRRARP